MAEPGDYDPARDVEEEPDLEDAEDQDNDDLHGNRRRRARALAGEIPLEGLLRLLAGQRVIVEQRRAAGSNEELMSGLKRTGMLNSEAVQRAMLTCPRGVFVPEAYRREAWVDSPIRVEEEDFNISAPHMHAQLLESLDICPGDRVLDVGCGCGFIAACAAVLAGKSGRVVGVDIKPTCVKLSQDNIARLAATSSAFASAAGPVEIFKHNVFIPHQQLRGKFNKVCVGATCPEERLHLLLHLLEPAGGKLLAPVDSDLRLYTRGADGSIRQRMVSSVRFSDLEVPSDASIVLSVMQQERAAQMAVAVSPPTLNTDLPHQANSGCGGGFMQILSTCFNGNSISSIGQNGHSFNTSTQHAGSDHDSLQTPETPVIRNHKPGSSNGHAAAAAPAGEEETAAAASTEADMLAEAPAAPVAASAGGDDTHMSDHDTGSSSAVKQVWQAGAAAGLVLGEPDCELLGPGWSLQAHKQVLKSRAAHFRARLSSGMRDAHDCQHKVPEGFTLAALQGLLLYLYTDQLPPGLEPAAVVELLHAAAYYGTPRLIELCEASLVGELLRLPLPAAAAEAPHLLCLADELGLAQLRRAAVGFIAQHYADVQASEGWAALDKAQVEALAGDLAGQLARLTGLLRDLEPPSGAAALPKRRSWW